MLRCTNLEPLDKVIALKLDTWRASAACGEAPRSLFFDEASVDDAKAYCATCNVRQQCLDNSMLFNDDFGVRGGLTEEERRLLRQQRYRTTSAFRYDTESALRAVSESWSARDAL